MKGEEKGGGGYRTSSTSGEALYTGFDSFPRYAFDFTPVITSRTRTVRSSDCSTEQPQMIRAIGLIFVMPLIDCIRISSATLNAASIGSRGTMSRSLSL